MRLITFFAFSIIVNQVTAEKVGVFYNSDYVQISEGSLFAEGSNILKSLESKAHEVSTFENIDFDTWKNVIDQNDLILIPELEKANLFADLSNETIQLLSDYVKNGGGLIICGVVAPIESNSGNAIDLLNGVFDLQLRADASTLEGNSNKIENNTLNTHFSICNTTIINNNSIAFLTSGLPTASKRIYNDALENNHTSVALIPLGAGKIVYLGWGWWNAFPVGAQDNGWIDVLDASVKEVACAAPIAKAKSSLTIEISEPETVLNAAMFDDGSYSCSSLQFRIFPKQLTCEQLGEQTILFEVIDDIGRVSNTTVTVNVTDPNEVCVAANTASIFGIIETADGDKIENVQLDIYGEQSSQTISLENGQFSFENMTMEYGYEVAAFKNDHPLNGVSTFDLTVISRHILGHHLIDSPYNLIAADINDSKSITTADIVELRRLILYQQTGFEHQDAWKFIPKDYVFENPLNPFEENVPTSTFIEVLNGNTAIHFIGIKIGDLDGSAVANSNEQHQDRHQETVLLEVNHLENKIVFMSSDIQQTTGFQLSINTTGMNVDDIQIVSTVFSNDELHINMDVDQQVMHVSCAASELKYMNDEAPLFSIHHANGTIQGLNTRFLKAEIYDGLNNQYAIEVHENSSSIMYENNAAQVELKNYPNPFSTHTQIHFNSATAANIALYVYNQQGQQVYALNQFVEQGAQIIELNANDWEGKGVFTYALHTPTQTVNNRMIKL